MASANEFHAFINLRFFWSNGNCVRKITNGGRLVVFTSKFFPSNKSKYYSAILLRNCVCKKKYCESFFPEKYFLFKFNGWEGKASQSQISTLQNGKKILRLKPHIALFHNIFKCSSAENSKSIHFTRSTAFLCANQICREATFTGEKINEVQ